MRFSSPTPTRSKLVHRKAPSEKHFGPIVQFDASRLRKKELKSFGDEKEDTYCSGEEGGRVCLVTADLSHIYRGRKRKKRAKLIDGLSLKNEKEGATGLVPRVSHAASLPFPSGS